MLEQASLAVIVLVIYLVAGMWGIFLGKVIFDQYFATA